MMLCYTFPSDGYEAVTAIHAALLAASKEQGISFYGEPELLMGAEGESYRIRLAYGEPSSGADLYSSIDVIDQGADPASIQVFGKVYYLP